MGDFATPTLDSAQTRAVYGIETFQNKSSAVTVTVPGGYVQLEASKIASDGTEGWTAEFGLRLPIDPQGKTHDLTGLTSITFEYQNSNTITDVLSVSFDSDAYPAANIQARTVYANDIAGKSALAAGTTWKQGEVLVSDFAPPSWWMDIPADYPSIDSVLKRVRSLVFMPKTLYSGSGNQNGIACTKCVNPTMTSQTLKIRNVKLSGWEGEPAILVPFEPETPVVVKQILPFQDLSVLPGASRFVFRFADYFQGAKGYSVRNLGPASRVVVTRTADSLFLDGSLLTAGLQDRIEVRAMSGIVILLDTFTVTSLKPAGGDSGLLLSAYADVALDSSETRAKYGIQTIQNKSSSVTTSVPGGYVQLVATKIASEGTEGYTAEIGLVHPLTKSWRAHDLTGLTRITFEYQNSTPITDVLSVSFGSPAYSDAITRAGTVYSDYVAGRTALAAGTTWKQAELYVSDFAPPVWWSEIPADYPTIDSVLKKVTSLVFRPQTLYSGPGSQNGTACTKCVGPTMTTQNLKIRNIRLVGISSLGPDTILPPPPVDSTKPAIPTLAAPAHGSLDVLTDEHLTWAQVAGAQSYLVQVDTSAAFPDPKQVRVSGANSWVSFRLAKNQKYSWRVLATNARGSSEWSPIWTFTTGAVDSQTVALRKARALRNWRRNGDRLTVVVPETVQRATLEVRGLDGKLVRTESAAPRAGEATWSLGNLHGTFFLQVRSEAKLLENRLLVLP